MAAADPPHGEDDVSLLRAVNFVLRYRRLLVLLPSLGFLAVAAGVWTAGSTSYTAEATVRAPRSGAPVQFEDVLGSPEVVNAAVRLGDGADGAALDEPRERLTFDRRDHRVRVRFRANSEARALGILDRLITQADSLYRARWLHQTTDTLVSEKLRRALGGLAAIEGQLYVRLRGDEPVHALYTLADSGRQRLYVLPRTRVDARTTYEVQQKFASLDSARSVVRSLLYGGHATGEALRNRHEAAEDSLHAWLSSSSPDELSAAEQYRYLSLLWRERTWRAAWMNANSPPAEPVVVERPALASIERLNPWRAGIIGLLAGGLVALAIAMAQDAVRRGRLRKSAEYETFREMWSGSESWIVRLAHWFRGDPPPRERN